MAKLKYGLVIDGKTYKDFTPKLLTIGGELAALDYLETAAPVASKIGQELLENTAYLAQQVEIAGVDVTPDLLLDKLASEDYYVINQAIEDLQKKSATA